MNRLPPVNLFSSRNLSARRVFGLSAAFLLFFAAVAVISMLVGPSGAGVSSLLKGLSSVWSQDDPAAATERSILFSIRLPRIIFTAIVGASLSLAGVVYQALLRNVLADPYILGIYGGAAVGAIIGIMTGASFLPGGIPASAFLGAILTIAFLFSIAGRGRSMPPNTLLLTGVITNAFFSAVIMFLITISKSTEIHGIMFWLMGDLGAANTGDILFAGLFFLAGFLVVYLFARALNLIVTGEETALQLGVPVERTKTILMLTASLLTAAAVSISGIIGFVGLIIPHLMRMTVGSDHRLLLPAAAIFGAAFLVAADAVARTVMAPAELPVGVITALCGAPYFIYLLRKKGV